MGKNEPQMRAEKGISMPEDRVQAFNSMRNAGLRELNDSTATLIY